MPHARQVKSVLDKHKKRDSWLLEDDTPYYVKKAVVWIKKKLPKENKLKSPGNDRGFVLLY